MQQKGIEEAFASQKYRDELPAPARKDTFVDSSPEVRDCHDPTDFVNIELVRNGIETSRTFVWGQATRNDAYLSPVPDDVPIALFNAVVRGIQTL
jgi:hypothetical protein